MFKNLQIMLRIRMIIYTLFCVGAYGYYALFVQGVKITYPEPEIEVSSIHDVLHKIK